MAIQAQLYPDAVIGGGFPRDWMATMENGNGNHSELLPFDLQQKPHHFQWMDRNAVLDDVARKSNAAISNANQHHHSMAFPSPRAMVLQAEEQGQELDRFVSLQNERLRLVLQQQSGRLISSLSAELESRASVLLKQKDEQIARSTRRTAELENLLRKLQAETQAWQRAAMENELMVQSLNNRLEQLRETAAAGSAMDAESCCDANEEAGEDMGGLESEKEQSAGKMACKSCDSRRSCVMFLPCRHLCSCKDCENLLHCCPICRLVKRASIEVLIC